MCIVFLKKPKFGGMSNSRLYYYAERIPELLKIFEKHGFELKICTKAVAYTVKKSKLGQGRALCVLLPAPIQDASTRG